MSSLRYRITFVLNGIKEIAKIHAGKEDKDSLLMDIVDQIDSFLRYALDVGTR